MPLLRPIIILDTQILSNVCAGTICPADWNAVLRYISKKCRYAISVNTLYELLAAAANGDANYFHTHQRRIRLLFQPAGREFLPTVGDFVRSKVFGLSARKPDFQPRKLRLWAEVVLAATSKSSLQGGGVVLQSRRHSTQTYRVDLDLLLKQIEDGKKSHSQRLEGLRQGKLRASTPDSWSRAVLSLIGVSETDAATKKLLVALDAAYRYDVSLYEMAKDHQYDFGKHDSDWIDSQQLYYLADSSVRIVTCDANIRFRIKDSAQWDRVWSFDQLKALAMSTVAAPVPTGTSASNIPMCLGGG